MCMGKQKTAKSRLLPFFVIAAAASGDVDAIDFVLKHYEGYIIALSTRRLYDEYGNSYSYIDEGLKRRLEIKLITKIMTFDVD